MSSKKLYIYLKAYRKRVDLSQVELAQLLGSIHGTTVSRYERRVRAPDFATAIACAFIYQVPMDDLFPGLHAEVHNIVRVRAATLITRLQAQPRSQRRDRKIEYLRSLIKDPVNSSRHGEQTQSKQYS